jgi:ABC-2 type transport system permease protein
MKTFLRASAILFHAHLWRTFRSKRGLIAAGLAALPVLLAFLVTQIARFEGPAPVELVFAIAWYPNVQVIVPLVALVLAGGVVAEEIDDRTITYLFTRPVPRASILLGRWFAAAVPIVILIGLSSWAVIQLLGTAGSAERTAEWLPEGFAARLVVTVMMGAAVYSAIFAAAGALFRHPIIVGLAYTFVIEVFLGNLPGSNQKATIAYYLKSFLFARDRDLIGELREALFSVELVSAPAAVRTLFLILVAVLALGAWRFTRREYVLAA